MNNNEFSNINMNININININVKEEKVVRMET